MNNKELGTIGEKLVFDFLIKKGYSILETNFQNRIAEIDIIAKFNDIICFIEVKTRKSIKYGYPREAVTVYKQRQIIKGAQSYIKFKNIKGYRFRFDVIEVFIETSEINHLENAFWV